MIRCIVIDADVPDQKSLVMRLKKLPNVEVMGVYDNAIEALVILKMNTVNLVFCDIQLPEVNAIDFLKSLYMPPLFVFVTKDPQYALLGYELSILDYILKPYPLERLIKTINKAQRILDIEKTNTTTNNFLIIKDRSAIIISPYHELIMIKGDKDYIWIETLDKKYHIWKKLIDMESILGPTKQFIRVHRSFIINLDFAKRVEGNLIKMKGETQDVPIGKQYKSLLYKRLGLINS